MYYNSASKLPYNNTQRSCSVSVMCFDLRVCVVDTCVYMYSLNLICSGYRLAGQGTCYTPAHQGYNIDVTFGLS